MPQSSLAPLPKLYINYIHRVKPHNMARQHYHDTYEVYFQVSGERDYFVRDQYYRIRGGDVILMRPLTLHNSTTPREAEHSRYVLNIAKAELDGIFTEEQLNHAFSMFQNQKISLLPEEAKRLYELFSCAEKEMTDKKELSDRYTRVIVAQMFIELKRLSEKKGFCEKVQPQNEIAKAVHYISGNFYHHLSLEEIAAKFHMSKYHFCRQFKKYTGATFLEYLNNIRLTHAHKLLLSTDLSIAKVAVSAGFDDTAHFSRVFKKKYNMAPRNFKQQ